jgi:tetratricopeptide (TPR) repeat protein
MGRDAIGSVTAVLASVLFLTACGVADSARSTTSVAASGTGGGKPAGSLGVDPCAVALAGEDGATAEDGEIARLREEARTAADAVPALERLGWTYVEKARLSYDQGFYRLAEQAALCMDEKRPGTPEALLLRGHVYHNLHRFKEGEAVARRLVAMRGDPFDWGLLGDVLMEQGKLDEAVPAYQTMVDAKPGLQAYSRAAHVRWLKGDLAGATQIMRMAAEAGSPRNRESVAWAYSRLAMYELQGGDAAAADSAVDQALFFADGYAPALLARGYLLLSAGKAADAVGPLDRAARENPLPEYQWALAEALRAAGLDARAAQVEAAMMRAGAEEDPRTFSLFLATRGEQVDTALRLARRELDRREDVFTQDALAWALAAAGRPEEARQRMQLALAQGTRDARLFYHAGVIAGMVGHKHEAERWFEKAREIRQMLLPAERERLTRQLAAL